MAAGPAEIDLYPPVKAFLEGQGYSVKGEVRGCDLVAVRGDEPPVVVELKLRFTLGLVFQGIERLTLTDAVYLAIPRAERRSAAPSAEHADVRKLCRMLGLGLMTVGSRGQVDIVIDPLPYRPRKAKARTALLLGEHARRVGDPNSGGSVKRKLVTAYRQEALLCAHFLRLQGPMTLKALRAAGPMPNAAKIMQHDVYGWFQRVAVGTYTITPAGLQGLEAFAAALEPLLRPV